MSDEHSVAVSQNESDAKREDEPVKSGESTLKQYFDEKLHPALSAALNACAEARPDDPVTFIGNYLLEHSRSI
jgi:hypothetical protein